MEEHLRQPRIDLLSDSRAKVIRYQEMTFFSLPPVQWTEILGQDGRWHRANGLDALPQEFTHPVEV